MTRVENSAGWSVRTWISPSGNKTRRCCSQREAQLIAAQRIQEFILPHRAPQVPGFDIAGKVLPAEFAGGDYFDFLMLPDGAMGIVVGDVSGHDVSAALIMASASAHLRSFAEDHDDVQEILFHTNAILSRETDDARFVTLFFLRLDPHTRQIRYVNAGHPSAYVLSQAGDVKQVLHSNSFPLSVLPDAEYPLSDVLELAPGDIVLLITDGILEARSPTGEFFDADHLLAVLRDNGHRSAAEIIDCVFAASSSVHGLPPAPGRPHSGRHQSRPESGVSVREKIS